MGRWALLGLILACGGSSGGEEGDPCLTSFDCVDGTVCFETQLRGNECMLTCEETDRICADGSVCLQSPSEARVCYRGGETLIGTACLSGGECEPGGVCVTAADDTRCQRACDRRAPSCGEGQVCIDLGDPAGYCGIEETTM